MTTGRHRGAARGLRPRPLLSSWAVAFLCTLPGGGPDRVLSTGAAADDSSRAVAASAVGAPSATTGTLPPGTRRGLAHRLRQYPVLALATPRERRAAERLLAGLRATASPWRDPAAAAAIGFDVRRPVRRAANRDEVLWLHAENRRWHADRHHLDPRRPDTLIYADMPGRPLLLVGVMISMPRGVLGPTPGGPITRWHHHLVCAEPGRRGLKPRADGSCPPGARLRHGSEMMHVWFTRDLRSAFAVHAPGPELCAARLLFPPFCDGRDLHAM